MQKLKIFVLQDFIHETDFGMERFFKDEVRFVSPEDASYFSVQAWATLNTDNKIVDKTSSETVLFVDDVKASMVKTYL